MLAGFGEQCQQPGNSRATAGQQPGNTPTPASQRPLMMRHAEEQCSPALAAAEEQRTQRHGSSEHHAASKSIGHKSRSLVTRPAAATGAEWFSRLPWLVFYSAPLCWQHAGIGVRDAEKKRDTAQGSITQQTPHRCDINNTRVTSRYRCYQGARQGARAQTRSHMGARWAIVGP